MIDDFVGLLKEKIKNPANGKMQINLVAFEPEESVALKLVFLIFIWR